MHLFKKSLLLICIVLFGTLSSFAQLRGKLQFTEDGNGYYSIEKGIVTQIDIATGKSSPFISEAQLTKPDGKKLKVASFSLSKDKSKLLIFTNTAKVWRYNTRGDYWVFDQSTSKLQQVGKNRPAQSLMYAKLSPDGKKVAYVSEHNIFSEDLATGDATQLTVDGTRKLINGTFDWVYEEEFGCRDGFRWSPDGSQIAYWQVDANQIRDYFMLNTTDSNYSRVVPVEYPKVGEAPSPVKIGVVAVNGGATRWMMIEGDPQQHYIPRMEWADANTLIIQQLDRKQQDSKLIYSNATDGTSTVFYTEHDNAWVEVRSYWNDDDPSGWDWVGKNRDFIWVSEKDGWRHIYRVSKDGKKETLLTNGKYDIGSIKCIDEASNYIYFSASPNNATQLYLYKVKMDGKSNFELVTPTSLQGTHEYSISPNGKWARHGFSNYKTEEVKEWISLPAHTPVDPAKSIAALAKPDENSTVQYTKVTLDDGTVLDAWINYPANFDKSKKYPVVFYVYGEPATQTVGDSYGNHQNYLYNGDMSGDGYFQIGIDNRGTPALRGAAWRKAIYRKIGDINIRDMAMGAKKILESPWFDKERVAVWGWSGGGSSTLNLMFRYSDIFQTGIAIAAVGNQLFYDNIYQERYMGLPQENREDFVKGSPITYAKGLKGNLLYIHGTGDDNVHYSNAEVLLNELIKYNKQFQFMAYPNRSHGLSEGQGTGLHLVTLYTTYLKAHCAPGPR